MQTKNIGYAYATSDIATKFKRPNGCYFFAIYDDAKPMQVKNIVEVANDKESLFAIAALYDIPYGTYSLTLAQGN